MAQETPINSLSPSHMPVFHGVSATYRKDRTSNDACVHFKNTAHHLGDCFINTQRSLLLSVLDVLPVGMVHLSVLEAWWLLLLSPDSSSQQAIFVLYGHPPFTSSPDLPPGNPTWFWPSPP